MPSWKHVFQLSHLIGKSVEPDTVRASMHRIGTILLVLPCFEHFEDRGGFSGVEDFRQANRLLDRLYNYCDRYGIWVE